MKKLLFLLLALPMLATAQEKYVQIPHSYCEGNPFTIRIPVRFPDSLAVQYAWYRNDTLVEDSHTLMLGEKTIAYTIPAEDAYGSAVYYFKYLLHDDFHEWTRSPKYAITFLACVQPEASAITGSIEVCANTAGLTYSVDSAANVAYTWAVPEGWTITAGQNTHSVTVTAGAASGTVSVTPFKDCAGEAQTLAVTVNPSPTAPTTAGYSCNNNQTATFTASGSTGGNGALTYLWNMNSGSSSHPTFSGPWFALTTRTLDYTIPIDYYVLAQDSNGCRSAMSYAASAFLPNNPPSAVGYSCNGNTNATFWAHSSKFKDTVGLSYLWSTVTTPNSGAWFPLTTTEPLSLGVITNIYLLTQDSLGCRSAVYTAANTVIAAGLPAQPSITGANLVCSGTAGNTYSVTNVSGVNYQWTIPSGWYYTAGGSGNSAATVTATATGGNIVVTPDINGCVGTARSLAVNTVPCGTSSCSGLNTPGGFIISTCNGVTNAGTISVTR